MNSKSPEVNRGVVQVHSRAIDAVMDEDASIAGVSSSLILKAIEGR